MRADERDALHVRFVFRCGYCGIRETDVGAPLTMVCWMLSPKPGPFISVSSASIVLV